MEKLQLISQISKLFIGTPQQHAELMQSLAGKAIPELQKIAAHLQIAAANREKTKLDLVRHGGLAPTARNWAIIDNRLGFYYTVQQFRGAIAQDAAFKQSLEWEKEPFAQVVQAEQRQQQFEQQQFAMFVGAAKAATAQGRNIAPNQANYQMVREAIEWGTSTEDQARDFNLQNVMALLFHNTLQLAPNDHEVARPIGSGAR